MSQENWRIAHLDNLESPWGNAGGVVKKVEDVEKMANTGVGWIEAGSYTLEPRLGNEYDPETGKLKLDEETGEPIKVYHYDPKTGEATNSLGMPNKGMDVVEKEIPEMVKIAEAYGKKLVVNIAPVTSEPIEETKELVARSYEGGAHAVILNGGCPNVETGGGGREEILTLYPGTTFLVLDGLTEIVQKYHKVQIRVSPQKSIAKARELYESVIRADTVSAVWVPNSWPNHQPLEENGKPILGVSGGIGGLTGPATSPLAQQQTAWALEFLNRSGIDVVRSGGIMDFKDEYLEVNAARALKRSLSMGAVAAAGSTFYYESKNGWAEDTDRLLQEFDKL